MNIKEFNEKFEIQEKQIDDSIKYQFLVFWKEKKECVFKLNLDIPISILYDLQVLYGIDKDKFIEDAKTSAKNAIYANFMVEDNY